MGGRKNNLIVQLLCLTFLLLAVFSCSQNSEAAIRKEFNYQGKLTDSNGLAVADGAYDITFKIYTQAGGGSAVFTESWTNAALFTESTTTVTNDGCAAGVDKIAYVTGTNESSLKVGQTLWNSTTKQSAVIESVVTGSNYICIYDPATAWTSGDTVTNRIYVKNGLFSTMVGSVTASTLGFTGDTYYLGVTIGTDSEMIPRKKIGSVPQAWNANNLSGDGIIDIDNNSTSQDAANISYNPTSGTYNAFSIIYGSGGGTGTALSVVQNGTGNIVDFKDGSTSVFKIADGGTLTIVATTNITGNTSVTGNLNVSGVINGGADMAPNLVKNSYMNILDGSVPAGYSGTGVTIESVSAYTKAFEGCYASSNAAPCDAATPDDATLASQYWYSSYNKGPRIQRGGLAGGWHSLSDGNILKITGTGIAPGSHSYVSMPFEKNVLGSTWHFKAWVKIVTGSQACFGSDAGYLGSAIGVCVTKAVADAADQGWYRFNGTTTTSQITSLDGLALSFGAIPDGSGNVEMYVALPYVANLNTYGTNKETWVPSIADSMSRNGLTIHPTTYNVGIGTTAPTSRLDVAYNSTNTALTVAQSGTGKIVDFKDGSTSALTVIDGGNVGIGTDSPNAKLNIYQNSPTANQVLFRVGTSDSGDRFYIDEDGDVVFGTGAQVNFSNGDAFGFNSIAIADPGASEGFRFNATTAGWYVDVSPLDRSNADGNLNLYGTANNIAFWRPTLWVYNSTNYTSATPTSTGGLDFTTTGTGDITFNPGGNIGIGTSSLSAKLTVSQASTGDVVDFKDGSVSVFKIADGGNVTMTALNFEQGVVAPVLRGSILSSTYMDAASAVAVQGKYAYVAGYGTDYLSVVDISSPTSPVIVGSVTSSSRLDAVTGVFVSGRYVYTTGSNQDYISIFDVSNPFAPTLAGSLQDTTRMDGASAIYVSGRHAFVTSFNNDYLAIEDISYPTPVLEGSLQSATYMDGARGVYVQGAYAYIAGFNSDSLAVVNITNTGSPALTGNLVNSTYMDGARGVYVSGKYAYIVAENSDSLAIVNIGNPAIPVLAGYLVDSTNLNGARSIQVSGKYAYIASSANNSISIVDISNPASPTFVTSLVDATNMAGAQSVFVKGKYAYVASETSDSLSVVELTGFDLPTARIGDLNAGSLDIDDNASIGNNLYVGNGIGVGVGGISSAGEITGYTSSTRSALWVSQAGTGDIMTLRDGTTSVFRVVDGGTVYAASIYPLSGNSYNLGSSAWDSTADFTITGEATNNYLGGALAAAGDLNGDGYPDLVVGANGYSSSTGRVYVYYGASTFNTTVDVTLNGSASSDFGYSISGMGDINGDGFDDLVVGAKSLNGTGEAYIYYGGSTMDATADVTLAAGVGDSDFGVNVDFAGDVNGDGFMDVLVGADGYDSSRGHAYLYFGGTSMDSTPDLTFTGENVGDLLGVQVSRAGDVNSDGFDDIVIGASGYSTATGRAYVYYGGSAMDNTADVVLTGSTTGLNFAKTGVAGIGDFNGDAYDDIIIGATGYTTNTGQEYIYFGGAPMNNVVDGTFTGAGTNYYFGCSAASAGDYNGDGFMDFIVGAYGYTTNTGRAYVYYGGLTVDTGIDITITGAAVSTSFGKSLASAVDLNRDGVKDIVIGAPEYTTSTGRTYVYNTVNYAWKSAWAQSVNVSRNIYINGGLTMNYRGINTVNQFGIYTPTWTIDRQGSATLNKLEVNQNSTASALTIKQDGTGNIADFKDGTTSVFTIADGGNVTMNARNFTQNAVNPVHKGKIENNPPSVSIYTPSDVYVQGKYAYIASNGSDYLQVVDISNPSSPLGAGNVGDNLWGISSVFVSGGFAYTTSSGGDGVEVFDISNPSSPLLLSSVADNEIFELNGARSIYISGKYAYVAAYDDDGVEILDISNPASPTHVGAITDDGTTELDGARSIYVQGKYAYVAAYDDDGVEILDISNPASPTHVGAITDDGINTALNGPTSIYVSGKYAYVAGYLDAGVEILDISNPVSPIHVGTFYYSGSYPYSIDVSGKYAYVANPDLNSVTVLDISSPTSPVQVGIITDDAITNLDGVCSVYVQGKYAYAVGYNDFALEILELSGFDLPTANIGDLSTSTLDVTDNANIANNLYVGNGLNVGQGGIYTSGAIAGYTSSASPALSITQNGTGNIMDLKDGTTSVFTIADGGNVTMNARNFTQNAVNPVHKGSIADDANTVLTGARGIFVQGKYAYVASWVGDGVEILDISNPSNPVHAGAITDDGTTELDGASSIYVSGRYAYVASLDDDGVEILDISNPSNPVHAGAITDDGTTELDGASSIYVSGKYAYVASVNDDGLEILDISNPASPTHAGAITDDGTTELDGAISIYVSGKYAYVTGTIDDGVEILDISNPANPTHVGAITDDGTTALDAAYSIYVSGKYAYVASQSDNGVEILDISNPASPTHVGSIIDGDNTLLSGPAGIYVSGKYAYVTSGDENGVEVLDVSNPSSPVHAGSIMYDTGMQLLGPAGIYVSGKYAYVADRTGHGVEILELSGFDLPTANIGDLSTSTLDVTDNANIANNLYVGNGLNVGQGGIYTSGAIAGYTSSASPALSITQNGTGNIMDLKDGTTSVFTIADGGNVTMNAMTFAQNAVNPVHKGVITDSGSTELLGSVGISIQGKYAYVAAYDDDGVEVLDISNPASPTHVGFITDNATTELDGASYIHVSGKYAYIASEVDDGVEILDVSNPASPVHVGAITDDATTLLDGAACIYVSGKYAYVAATVDDGIEVLDISDPANPTHVGKIADDATTELDGVYSLYISGKYLYATGTTDDGFEVMDISDPANPTHVGAITDNVTTELDGAADVYVSGKYAYVTGYNDDGVEILDISNPASPTHVGAITDNATTELDGAWPIRVSGKYAYVGSLDDDGVEILDISNPASPTHVGAITDDGTTALNTVYSLYIQGKYIYATSGSDNGVEVLEVAGFDLPTANIGDLSVSTIDVTDNANIANDLYVGNGLSVGSGGIYSSGSIGIFTDSAVAALTISQNGTGDLVDIKKTGGSIFKITQATVEVAQPLDVQVEGDVGIEYNLSFMNTSTSFINSAGPLTISAGDSNSYENLTLTTSGTGDVIVDIAGSTMGFRIVGTETTVFNVDGSGNVVIGGVNSSNADLTVKRNITTQGGNLALGSLSTPSGVAVTPVGTAGSTTYGYRISAINGNGETIAATTASTATGNATLSATNYNRITWSAVTGATGYKVYGRTSGSELYMATVNSPILLYNDTGTATPSGALPTSNTTGGTITYPATGGPKRSIILTAAGAETPTTNGAAQTKVDGTNHTYFVLDYDATTDESAYWHWTMPDSYNGGAIDVTYYWEAASTSAEVGWCFQAIGVQANNAEDVDSALSSAVCEVDTAQANANDLALVSELQATSNFAAGDYVSFKVFRDADQSTVGAGNDDMAGDARLVKVKIEYSVNAESD